MVAVGRRFVLAGKPDRIRLGLRIKNETATTNWSERSAVVAAGCLVGLPFMAP
jgi:hypothetical protein